MANKIVKDFTFSREQGFTGSAGQTHVSGYARGGKSSKAPKVKASKPAKVAAPRKMRSKQGPALPPPMPPPAMEAPALGPLAVAGGMGPGAPAMGPGGPAMGPGGPPMEPSLMNARNGGRSRKR